MSVPHHTEERDCISLICRRNLGEKRTNKPTARPGTTLPAVAGSPHDDLSPPVARFSDIIGSLSNHRLALAAPGGLDDFGRDSAPDQQVPHPEGALQGQRVVVLIAADEI